MDGFVSRYERSAASRKEKGEPAQGFLEREIARKADCFANVCQVFSTYESRHTASDAKPFERGVTRSSSSTTANAGGLPRSPGTLKSPTSRSRRNTSGAQVLAGEHLIG